MSIVDQLDTVTDASAGSVDRHATTQTFESTNPASDAVVGVFPVHDADAVRETVERARGASEQWAALGFDGRRQRLSAFRGYLARRMNELADLSAAHGWFLDDGSKSVWAIVQADAAGCTG